MVIVQAPVNFALIKYWGKRDDTLNLPSTSSLSISVKELYTITEARFVSNEGDDEISINKETLHDKESGKILTHLQFLKNYFKKQGSFIIKSENNFPRNAGLASSASGFCALTTACILAMEKQWKSTDELSILCRRGSGSSCRSLYGGFVLWDKGKALDGHDSVSKPLFDENHWSDLRCMVVCISNQEKEMSSSAGMKHSKETSAFYEHWVSSHENDLLKTIEYIKDKNFLSLAEIIEYNCMKMFAVHLSSFPPILYWLPETIRLLHLLKKLKAEGFHLGYTLDAGPQVKILVHKKDCESLQKIITKNIQYSLSITSEIGEGMKILNRG